MTVKELKNLLKSADDDMLVLLPVDMGNFDGFFKSPCVVESGVAEMGDNEDLGTVRKDFVLVPCGFFEEKHIDPELN